MNLNKAIKHKIIHGLVTEAIKKHAEPTNKALKSVDRLWKFAFADEFARQVPELPRERWAELLQDGVLKPVGRGSVFERDAKGTAVNACSVQITFRASEGKVTDYDKERLVLATSLVYKCISATDTLSRYYSAHNGYTIYPDLSYPDVPVCAGVGYVDPDKDKPANEFHEHCATVMPHSRKAVQRVVEIIQQADELIEQLTDLLEPIKTDKRLAELLPEAMNYLPKQVKTSNVIPADVYNDLRAKLAAGIPA